MIKLFLFAQKCIASSTAHTFRTPQKVPNDHGYNIIYLQHRIKIKEMIFVGSYILKL